LQTSETKNKMKTDLSVYEIQATFCRAMGHPVRLRMLHLLNEAGEPLASSSMLEDLGIAKPAMSQHISKMVSVGLIRTSRRGRFTYIQLAHPEIGQACGLVGCALSRHAKEQARVFES
jgi:DNA-binding transcriptional ArsR family regulator